MKRTHALLLALLLGVAVVAATFAVATTTSLGTSAQAAPSASGAKIATRNAALDKAEAALRHALKKKPPALPKLPKHQAAHTVQVVSSSAPTQPAAAAPSAASSSSPSSDDPPSHETEPQDSGAGDD
jgi:hypothetical protein